MITSKLQCGLFLRGAMLWALGVLALAQFGFAAENAGPKPRVVDPGSPEKPPADAIVLFDGKDLSKWVNSRGADPHWEIQNGELICKSGSGGIMTKDSFGDAQIHVEFSTASEPDKHGQDRSNSGVYMQGRYEVQVLDSYQDETYADGQCGAIYGIAPPLVNVCRPPGQWQTYDIIFRAPRWDPDSKKSRNAILTVFQNGVLIQDHVEVPKSTTAARFQEGVGQGPLYLQDHGSPLRYRNIWLRPLDN